VNALKDLLRGIRRHPLTTGGHIFVAFSVLWTITEALSYFVPGIIIKGPIALGTDSHQHPLWLKEGLEAIEGCD